MTVSLVAPPPIRSPRRPVTFQFWENGFQLERRGREPERPPRRVVVGRDQKGAWSARRPPPFILTAPLCRACCCWSGRWRRQERPICSALLCSALCMCVCVCMSAHTCCVYVWFAREPAKIKEQAGQREPARNARTQAGRGTEAARERSASNRTVRCERWSRPHRGSFCCRC